MSKHESEPATSPGKGGQGSTRQPKPQRAREFGGPKGPEPTRYGDWERNGRCSDF